MRRMAAGLVGVLGIAGLATGCAGILAAPDHPDPDDREHPLRVHQRMADEALRLHLEAHRAALEAAERARHGDPAAPPGAVR